MAGFFSKLFGGGGEKKNDLEKVVEATLNGILEWLPMLNSLKYSR